MTTNINNNSNKSKLELNNDLDLAIIYLANKCFHFYGKIPSETFMSECAATK
jgi:hypothetical protein